MARHPNTGCQQRHLFGTQPRAALASRRRPTLGHTERTRPPRPLARPERGPIYRQRPRRRRTHSRRHLSIPLPGSARSAQAKAAYEEALAAQSRLQLAQAQWSAAFDAQTALVQARIASAQQLKEAAAAQTDAANKSSKAYSLGEGSMAELIQIQRNAVEQQRDAIRQALLAAQTWANLQLDLHLLWDMDE